MVSNKIKQFYNTVLSQVFSSCGKYLFIGNNFGDIFVYSVEQFITHANETNINENQIKQIQIYNVSEKHQIHSLSFINNFLIVGTNGDISGYSWSETQEKILKKVWSIHIPIQAYDTQDVNEVTSLWFNKKQEHLYAACGNSIYVYNIEDRQLVKTYAEHKDYIHCIDGNNNQLVSASEDGSVKIWDIRQKNSIGNIEPNKNKDLERPTLGKWLGAASITDDWLICGGGPKPSLWHLGSMECSTIFSFDNEVHVTSFLDDNILIGGNNLLEQYSLNGNITTEIPILSTNILTMIYQLQPIKLMSIGGSSNKIDICSNFNYRDITINLYK